VIADAFWLAAGLAVIIKGGDLFVSAGVRIAELLRVPRLVIGSTLVSLATTSPELAVSVMAGARGEPGLALGNAIGSCLCNTTLVLGVMAVLGRIEVHPGALRVPLTVMLGLAAALFLLTLDLEVSRPQGLALLGTGVAYFAYDFLRHRRARRAADVVEASSIEHGLVVGHPWLLTGRGTALQFTVGAIMVVAGSRLLVDGAVALASAVAVPSLVVGLTVVALGTSLPELVTAVSSARRRATDLGIGNILGANVANLTLIPGAATALASVGVDRAEQLFNTTAMLGAMAWVALLIVRRGGISRRAGTGLLAFYAVYLAGLVLLSTALRP
jgi:cation:H+ antiporter